MASHIAKARAEYDKLPEVTDDTNHWDGTVAHLVYWAQHEIDLVEEGELETAMPAANERKLRAFISKWSAQIGAAALRKSEKMMSYRPVVRCTSCGIETTNQPEGDGCHACFRGVMRLVG